MTNFQLDIAIVGAGLAGLSTAIVLARANHRVTVFEKAPVLGEIGAGINVTPNAVRIFKQWGLFEQLKQHAIVYQKASLLSYRNGDVLASIPSDPEVTFGNPDMVVHRADLHLMLAEEAQRCDVKIGLGVDIFRVKSVPLSKPTITFSEGNTIEWDLIIGADGERSFVRNNLLSEEVHLRDSGEHVFRMSLPMSDVLHDEDFGRLVDPPNKLCWIGPGGTALIYPIKRGDLLNIVLSQEHESGQVPVLKPEPVELQHVLDEFSNWDPLLLKLLGRCDRCLQWTLLQSDEVPTWSDAEGKVILIGDAAHPTPPYLGQGAAMAFEDAAVLGELFSLVNRKEDVSLAVKVFEKMRKPRTKEVRRLSLQMRDVYVMRDGEQQQQRDQQLMSGVKEVGNPFFLLDPAIVSFLFDYNTAREAQDAWHSVAAKVVD